MDLAKIGESAITGGAGSIIGAGLGMLGSVVQRRQQEKLMEKQWQYQKKAFQMENERQDWLMQNSQSIAKAALAQAGYSTADPNGTGVTAAATGSMESPSQSPPSADIGVAALQGAQVAANIKLANAQAAKIESETDYQKMYNELYAAYGKDQLLAALQNLDEDTQLKIATRLKTDQDKLNSIEVTDAMVKDIKERLDMDWAKLEPTVQLICAQAFEAEAKGYLSKAEIDKVYQDIKESEQRIKNLKKEIELDDAQIAVCYAQVANYEADTGLKKASTGKVKSERNAQNIENEYNRLMLDLKKSLGDKYNRAEMVYKALVPLAGSASILNRGK